MSAVKYIPLKDADRDINLDERRRLAGFMMAMSRVNGAHLDAKTALKWAGEIVGRLDAE